MSFKLHSPIIINSNSGIRRDFVSGLRAGGNGDMSNQIGGHGNGGVLKEATRKRTFLGQTKTWCKGNSQESTRMAPVRLLAIEGT